MWRMFHLCNSKLEISDIYNFSHLKKKKKPTEAQKNSNFIIHMMWDRDQLWWVSVLNNAEVSCSSHCADKLGEAGSGDWQSVSISEGTWWTGGEYQGLKQSKGKRERSICTTCLSGTTAQCNTIHYNLRILTLWLWSCSILRVCQ